MTWRRSEVRADDTLGRALRRSEPYAVLAPLGVGWVLDTAEGRVGCSSVDVLCNVAGLGVPDEGELLWVEG